MRYITGTRKVAVAGLLVIALVLLGACASGPSQEEVNSLAADLQKLAADTQKATTDVTGVKGQVSTLGAALAPKTQRLQIIMGETKTIEVVSGEDQLTDEIHEWQPGVIVVNKGDKVILEVLNPRSKVHSLVLKEFGVDTKDLAPRTGKATVEFVADKAGSFQFACGVDPAESPYKGRTDACEIDHKYQVGYLIVLER